MFHASNRQKIDEKIAKYDQNGKTRKTRFLGPKLKNLKKCDPCHFLIDQSECVHI